MSCSRDGKYPGSLGRPCRKACNMNPKGGQPWGTGRKSPTSHQQHCQVLHQIPQHSHTRRNHQSHQQAKKTKPRLLRDQRRPHQVCTHSYPSNLLTAMLQQKYSPELFKMGILTPCIKKDKDAHVHRHPQRYRNNSTAQQTL